jgi:hypothetical protein
LNSPRKYTEIFSGVPEESAGGGKKTAGEVNEERLTDSKASVSP